MATARSWPIEGLGHSPDGAALRSAPRRGEAIADQLLCFLHEALQLRPAAEALGVDFVDLFGPRRPGSKPAVLGQHFQALDRRAIARSLAQDLGDLLP